VEILAQSSTAFVLTHNFQGTHILGASRGRLAIAWHLVYLGIARRRIATICHWRIIQLNCVVRVETSALAPLLSVPRTRTDCPTWSRVSLVFEQNNG